MIDKLKHLSTTPSIMLRQMRRDHEPIDFFCKFIICSNREKEFIVANEHDKRYWVRKISKFDKFDPNYLNRLTVEIPAFLGFLTTRKLASSREGRMHFDMDMLRTDAFDTLVRASKDEAIKDFLETMIELLEDSGHEAVKFTIKDLREQYFDKQRLLTHSKIKSILQDELKINPSEYPYRFTYFGTNQIKTGRYYELRLEDLKKALNITYYTPPAIETINNSNNNEVLPF
jgi:hypothetical protein